MNGRTIETLDKPCREAFGPVPDDPQNDFSTSLSFSIASERYENKLFHYARHLGDAPAGGEPILIGSVGTDVMLGHVFLIDFPRSRFAIADEGNIQAPDYKGAAFAKIEFFEGLPLVDVAYGGRRLGRFQIDTGTASAVSVSAKIWQSLTDDPATKASVRNREIPDASWGRTIRMAALPLTGTVQIAGIDLPPSATDGIEIDYSEIETKKSWVPYIADNAGQPWQGIVGNALFSQDCVVIFDFIGDEFGVARKPE